jgi:hypothetical protein
MSDVSAKEYIEKLEKSGLMNENNRNAILAVAEMIKHPLTLEEMRLQIYKGCPELVRPKGWKPKQI